MKTKEDIIRVVSRRAGLSKEDSSIAIEAGIKAISRRLQTVGKCKIYRFGRFSINRIRTPLGHHSKSISRPSRKYSVTQIRFDTFKSYRRLLESPAPLPLFRHLRPRSWLIKEFIPQGLTRTATGVVSDFFVVVSHLLSHKEVVQIDGLGTFAVTWSKSRPFKPQEVAIFRNYSATRNSEKSITTLPPHPRISFHASPSFINKG